MEKNIPKETMQQLLEAHKLSIYPTYNKLQEAINAACDALPEVSPTLITKLLYGYHNTLLNSLQKQLEHLHETPDR